MKIGVVPYINALPLCKYLNLPVTFATPVELQELVQTGKLDCALLPSFSYLQNPSYIGYGEAGVIQSGGPVESVKIFTRRHLSHPLQIKSINYSEDSVTSISLFKVIYTKCWGNHLHDLKLASKENADAILKIGDAALFFQEKKSYQDVDLGEVWTDWTGLPFVYALWVAPKKLPIEILDSLKKARAEGLQKLDEIIAGCPDLPPERMRKYLTQSIQYEMTSSSLAGLRKFQDYCLEIGLLKVRRPL